MTWVRMLFGCYILYCVCRDGLKKKSASFNCVHCEPVAFVFPHSLPITVNVKLAYISDPSDRHSYNCSRNFPISGTITETSPSILNQCQFNRTGKFQLDATFENDASSYHQTFDFTISDGNGCITSCSCFGILGVAIVSSSVVHTGFEVGEEMNKGSLHITPILLQTYCAVTICV